jgi:Na+/H+ antiporter NhaD/arsenite permease-like protein
MNRQSRLYAHVILFVIGIVLMVGGVVTKKYGASIVGLIVAAVDYWQWDGWRRQSSTGDSLKPKP